MGKNKNEVLLGVELACLFEIMDGYESVLSKFDANSIINSNIEFVLADGSVFKAKIVDILKTRILEYISDN